MSSGESSADTNEDKATGQDFEERLAKLEEKVEQTTAKLSGLITPQVTSLAEANEALQESKRVLEEKVAGFEDRLDKASPPKLIELAEKSFQGVLDADYHLDDKASRILSAMAFLTAAAAAIFAKAYSPALPGDYEAKISAALSTHLSPASLSPVTTSVIQSLNPPGTSIFGLDLSLLSFLGYMFFVLIGATFFLAALGPALNKPKNWFRKESEEITSRLFYDLIGGLTAEAWKAHWTGSTPQDRKLRPEILQTDIENDYIYEARLLAEKAQGKFLWMSVGSVCFRFAFLFLIPLVASLFSSNHKAIALFSVIGIGLIVATSIIERLTRPPRPKGIRDLPSWSIWLIAIDILLIIYVALILNDVRSSVFATLGFMWGFVLSSYSSYKSLRKWNWKSDVVGLLFVTLAFLSLLGLIKVLWGQNS